jgi:hypothetical protein
MTWVVASLRFAFANSLTPNEDMWLPRVIWTIQCSFSQQTFVLKRRFACQKSTSLGYFSVSAFLQLEKIRYNYSQGRIWCYSDRFSWHQWSPRTRKEVNVNPASDPSPKHRVTPSQPNYRRRKHQPIFWLNKLPIGVTLMASWGQSAC